MLIWNWIRIRKNDADPLDPDPDPQHCSTVLYSVTDLTPRVVVNTVGREEFAQFINVLLLGVRICQHRPRILFQIHFYHFFLHFQQYAAESARKKKLFLIRIRVKNLADSNTDPDSIEI